MPSGIESIVFPTMTSIEKDWEHFTEKHCIKVPQAYLDAVEMPYNCVSSLQIGLCTACNFNCPMCFNHFEREYTYYKNRELTFEEVQNLVRNNSPINDLAFAVSGEPFLHRDIFRILEMARPHVETFTFSTNAGLLDREKIQRLRDFPIKTIYVSADGSDRETYERFRKNGNYDTFKKNVEMLAEALGDRVVIAATVFRENQESLLSMPELCAGLGVRHLVVFRLFEHPKASERGIQKLDREEMKHFMVSLLERCDTHGIVPRWDTRAVDYATAKYLQEATGGRYGKDLEVYSRPCATPFHNLLIDPEGNYNFCCSIEPIPKDALRTPARLLFNTSEIKMMRVMNLFRRFPRVCRRFCGKISDDRVDVSLDNLIRWVRSEKFESMNWRIVDRVAPGSRVVVAPLGTMSRELLSDGFFTGSVVAAVADRAHERLASDGIREPIVGYESLDGLDYDTLVITSGAYWREILFWIMERTEWRSKKIYRIDNIRRELRYFDIDPSFNW